MVFHNKLQEFQFYDKYSRWNRELNRRETWAESIQRSVDFLRELSENKLPEQDYQDIYNAMYNMEVFPSMRLFAMAGEAGRRDNNVLYNCSYCSIDSLESMKEVLSLSMAGCGVGFSAEKEYIDQLPKPKERTGLVKSYQIPDTAEGWCDAFYFGLQNWFDGNDVEFDYSLIRPAGTPLKTKTGRASGPKPLQELFNVAKKIIRNSQNRKLETIEVYDIVTKIGDCAVSGGSRRSAMICLFDKNDDKMLHAKDYGWWKFAPQRANANNSVVIDEDLTREEWAHIMYIMHNGGGGEPGFFIRKNVGKFAPRRKDNEKFGVNPCIAGDTLVAVADGRGDVPMGVLAAEGNDVPVYTINNKGAIQVRMMRSPRKTRSSAPVYKVTLDSGDTIKVTENHKFLKRDGSYVEAIDLKKNDSLFIMTKYDASFEELFKGSNSRSQDYTWINYGQRKSVAEHRLIASFYHNDGKQIKDGYIVHHKDYNGRNNNPDNLQIMSKKDHDAYHATDMIGDKNPMVRAQAEWTEEKWQDYKQKMSNAVSGKKNGKFSGYSSDDLKKHAIILAKSLKRRPSTNEWQEYAKQNGLPQSFSGWRKNHLGGISGFLKNAAVVLGYEHTSADPRIQQSYIDLTSEGYDCDIINNKIVFNKRCEFCNAEFQSERKETGVCSHRCSSLLTHRNTEYSEKLKNSIKNGWEAKKTEVRNKQIGIYLDLKSKLQREPYKKEWEMSCKNSGISTEIARQTSPFRYYKDLKQAADMYNHRVISIEFAGYEDVYNGTVDEYHNFFVGGWQGQTKSGKNKQVYLNNLQCGEINLRPQELCNLSQSILRSTDTIETLRNKIRIATILGTIQSLATYFPNLRQQWKDNCDEERLLGVDITGQLDNISLLTEDNLLGLKQLAIDTNKKYAEILGINQSVAITAIKPSGNSSILFDCSPGLHPRWSKYYIRRLRVNANSPIRQLLEYHGLTLHPENGQKYETANTLVVEFPVKSPDDAICRNDFTAMQQLEHWKKNKLFYTEHNPSMTCYYKPEELEQIIDWIFENQDIVGGISFLPGDDHYYPLAPYEEITKEKYEEMLSIFPEIDFSLLQYFETEDNTSVSQEVACVAGVCEL